MCPTYVDRCFPARVVQVSHLAGVCHLTSVFVWERERQTGWISLLLYSTSNALHTWLLLAPQTSALNCLAFLLKLSQCVRLSETGLWVPVCAQLWCTLGKVMSLLPREPIIGEAASGSKWPISRNWTRSVCTIHFYCSNSCVSFSFLVTCMFVCVRFVEPLLCSLDQMIWAVGHDGAVFPHS